MQKNPVKKQVNDIKTFECFLVLEQFFPPTMRGKK